VNLREIFGLMKDAGEQFRILHKKKLHNLYRSLNIVWMVKSKRLQLASCVLVHKIMEKKNVHRILAGEPPGK
jgi:hypothetical protein